MSVARARAVTRYTNHSSTRRNAVEMSVARARALTQFTHSLRPNQHPVEMSVARARALTHIFDMHDKSMKQS